MAIFEKFEPIAAARRALAESGLDSINVVMEQVLSPTEAMINGRRTILAGTNNYLGLTFHPECVEAACQALQAEGTGTTGSRAANGNYNGHVALELELADFFGARSVIVFSTGYVANLGMISTLTGPGDVLLIDADSHASIYDGGATAGEGKPKKVVKRCRAATAPACFGLPVRSPRCGWRPPAWKVYC